MDTWIQKWSGIGVLVAVVSCSSSPKVWTFKNQIALDTITPIGITTFRDTLWISDGDHNRLIQLDRNGQLLSSYEGYDRPMHIDSDANQLYIPEYGSDHITTLVDGESNPILIPKKLDAPTGVGAANGRMAITDFYHHQIHYFDQRTWRSFGKKGHEKGQFYYPTDVQIIKDKIYVADAYNHRVQVLDTTGKLIQVIGEAEDIKAATGVFVSEDQIFITDFEQNRVLVYLHNGSLQQILTQSLDKPTDVFYTAGTLWVTNYGSKSIAIYKCL